jgi:hypothetical protein
VKASLLRGDYQIKKELPIDGTTPTLSPNMGRGLGEGSGGMRKKDY